MPELFADMALYAFVVAEEPDRSLHLETLVRVALEHRLLKPVARDLRYRPVAGIVERTVCLTDAVGSRVAIGEDGCPCK